MINKDWNLSEKIKETERKIKEFEPRNRMGYWNDEIHDLEIRLVTLKEIASEG